MSLDITIKLKKPIVCPNCGLVVTYETEKGLYTSGQEYKPILEILGYGDDQYAKEMLLSDEKARLFYQECQKTDAYASKRIAEIVAYAICSSGNYVIFIEADRYQEGMTVW